MKNGPQNPYDVIAHVYDQQVHTEVAEEFYNRCMRLAETYLGSVKNLRVLDIGCGTGILASLLSIAGASVVGIDTSINMLKLAGARAQNCHGRIMLARGSALDLPICGEFHLIVACNEVINQWCNNGELLMALNNLRSVMRRNGLLVFDALSKENFERYWNNRHWQEGSPNKQLWMDCSWNPKNSQGIAHLTAICGDDDSYSIHSTKLVQYWHSIDIIQNYLNLLQLHTLKCDDWNPGVELQPEGFVDRNLWVIRRNHE